MNRRKIVTQTINLILAFMFAIQSFPMQAAVPQTLNYQGQLANAAGVPINATISMTFKLYDTDTGGAALWSETQSVAVNNGLYSVALGKVTPINLPFDVPYYLGIQVGADAEMAPRIALASSATALRAATADTLASFATVDGSQVTGTLSNVTISGATLVNTQLSATSAVCDAAHEGALRWVAATKTFEGCTGTAWMALSQEPLFRITAVDTVGIVGAYTSIAIGADGLPIIAYWDQTTSNNPRIKLMKCGNTACLAGNTSTNVDTTSFSGNYDTSIAIGANGLPVIAYSSNSLGIVVVNCGNAACSAGNTVGDVHTTFAMGRYPSIAIGADGLPVISYYGSTNADLMVAKCVNVACTPGTSTFSTVDSTGMVGKYSSIGIGADGFPVISYFDATTSTIKVAHCGNAACSAGNTVTTVDAAWDVGVEGRHTSLSIGTDGLPVISYVGGGVNFGFKVAKCGNAACSANNTLTVVDSVGAFSSLSIGADGLPIVSYHDVTNLDLKMVKCGNAACSAGNTIAAVDMIGNTGYYTSLSIGTDGLPVISYYDYTNNDLRVAKRTVPFQ